MASDPGGRPRGGSRLAIYVEDGLVLLGIAALFVFTVFFRERWWGQVALMATGLVMVVVFIRRFRRVHRAFTGRDEGR
jgi:hypothetical protein